MRTISIVNLKGGVGKTITTVNMAAAMAASGLHVLVIDADAQANTTRFFGLNPPECNSLSTVLRGEGETWNEYVYDTNCDGVEIVPASIDLIEADIASVQRGNAAKSIADFIAAIEEDERFGQSEGMPEKAFDYCIVDCPPSFTASSVAAIAASDDVIIPVKLDKFALDGLSELTTQIDGVRSIKPKISIAGVLITMWHRCDVCTQGEQLLRNAALPVFRRHIRRCDKVDESTFVHQPLARLSPNCAAAVDYKAFTAEYLEGVR